MKYVYDFKGMTGREFDIYSKYMAQGVVLEERLPFDDFRKAIKAGEKECLEHLENKSLHLKAQGIALDHIFDNEIGEPNNDNDK